VGLGIANRFGFATMFLVLIVLSTFTAVGFVALGRKTASGT
jgi:hypothetical protein